jgi:DNA repair photolyase
VSYKIRILKGKKKFMKKISGTKEWASHVVNCITGCEHNCRYCVSPDTIILMSDGSTKIIDDIKPGDSIIGVEEKLVKTKNRIISKMQL